MVGTYAGVAQNEDHENHGASPALSPSPALSSSPFPMLRSVDATFTPVSMDSDSYPNNGVEDKLSDLLHDEESHEDQKRSISQTPTAQPDAVDALNLTQSVTASARATVATEPTKSEYDLLSASLGAVDAASITRSSPIANLQNTRSNTEAEQQQNSVAPTNSAFNGANWKATTDHNQILGSASTEEAAPLSHSSNTQQPTILKPKPILRTASTKSVTLIHPSPSVRSRSSSHVSNIAQLEATAEKLSMTSSIEDAIRDLREEQKRSDSRRSSILAASTGFPPDFKDKEPFPFARQVSATSSIRETNNAARHGGYSPAGYVMSPNNSLLSHSSRLRSASHTRSDPESNDQLTRNGPGKSSMRSVKSATKPLLTNIAEMEPTGLTLAAMDEADKLAGLPEEDEPMRMPHMEDVDLTPNAYQPDYSAAEDYWGNAVAQAAHNQQAQQAQQHQQQQQKQRHQHQERAKSPTGSTGTFEQAELAFADFDGHHCPPDEAHNSDDDDPFQPSLDIDLSLQMPINEPGRPTISAPRNPTVRPKSYLDPETGQQMMYYPARVPMMLNLPQKLSKRPKAAVRNQRQSQVLSVMPEANRQSAAWLPEVLPEPLVDPLVSGSNSQLPTPQARPNSVLGLPSNLLALEDEPEPQPQEVMPQRRPNPRPVDEEARKSRMSAFDPADKRKSRMSYAVDNLPPQLRASAFFDIPSESPQIELKDGSAMATLDSILDASAAAPVSAFTDHAFAGKLGNEIYGTEKRKSHMKSASTATALDVKKRSSIFHLRTPSKISTKGNTQDERRNTIIEPPKLPNPIDGESDDERTKLSASVDGENTHEGEEEEDEDNEEGSDDDLEAYGPPTTLLAELQLRKRQQKLRTKAPTHLYPNGMHSTLLEIDIVAEMELKNRKGKKINLAWEGQNDAVDESDDEDVPLGLLAARKNGQMTRMQEELNRPLGLMEQRNLDDNEPLSRRRDRLQGRPVLAPRQTLLQLGDRGAMGMSGGLGPPSPGLRVHTPDEDENEGETLAARMRRLRARDEEENPLPQARPLGDTFKEDQASQPSDKGKEKAALPEEEETLGQRRRRLQAEREAREKEMGAAGVVGALQPSAPPMLKERHSMADVLGATRRTILTDPRAEAERAKQEEAHRFRKDQGHKLAGFRAQMPTNLSTPNTQRSGGYMAGQYNDATGGGIGHARTPSHHRIQAPSMQPMDLNGGKGVMMGNVYGAAGMGGYHTLQHSYSQGNLGYNGMPLQMQTLPMPLQQPGQQYDRVDRWRQSIVP
ncbi:hypothetical protein BKA67DRAFT_531757 [Truncatella angustata]|uniref:Uncharacterized protein n=1 Tax=Truncatella angustata TaxID=152316 RepID=A0A9P8UQG5_9PEZI|nr:uncharacterized protein BKA67DRAFT_531757 [Truncatella angustata]KAH6656489.1 hypothetical protein BKA67DRAFT_531757 [Truncatella angustata]